MSVKKNIAVARKWNEEVIGKKQIDELAAVLHERYHWRGGTEGGPWSTTFADREAAKKSFSDSVAQMPNLRVVVEDAFGQKDRVAVRVTIWNGQKAVNQVIAIYRFEEGKIVDDWACSTETK